MKKGLLLWVKKNYVFEDLFDAVASVDNFKRGHPVIGEIWLAVKSLLSYAD